MGDKKVQKSATSDASGTNNLEMAMETLPVPLEKHQKNKFALGCTMLASMSSILLGYGESSVSPIFAVKDKKIRFGFCFWIEEMPLFFSKMRSKEIPS